MTITAIVKALVSAGASPEQIAAAVEAAEAASIAADEERRRKARDKKRGQRLSRGQMGTNGDDGGQTGTTPDKERSPTPPKEINPSPSEAKASSGVARTPADELAQVLDRDHAEAVVAHRKAMGKKLTPHAAKLLAGKFAQVSDPNAGADTMIANGWQGFEPAWMARQTGPPRGRSQNGFAAVALETMQEIFDEQSRQGHHNGHASAAGPDAGTVPPDRGADQRGNEGGRQDGSAARQEHFARGQAGHAGPVIDLEVEPRPARSQGH